MDTTQTITHVSLCAGYGGIDLGLKRAIPGLRTIAFSEIEAFAVANLVAKMEAGQLDPAPVWTDLKTFPWHQFRGKVDILSTGYPCQPFSAAGLRKGADDQRHLWPAIADGISVLQPAVCFFENVEGHVSLGLQDVLRDLGSRGYTATWGIFSASEVGAPHQRKRVFVLAYRGSQRGQLSDWWRLAGQQELERDGAAGRAVMANGISPGPQGGAAKQTDAGGLQRTAGRGSCDLWPSRPGQPQHGWEPPRVVGDAEELRRPGLCESQSSIVSEQISELTHTSIGQTQPALGGDADGPAGRMGYAKLCVSGDNRTDELRALGNGVVPATAAVAFTTLIQELFP